MKPSSAGKITSSFTESTIHAVHQHQVRDEMNGAHIEDEDYIEQPKGK